MHLNSLVNNNTCYDMCVPLVKYITIHDTICVYLVKYIIILHTESCLQILCISIQSGDLTCAIHTGLLVYINLHMCHVWVSFRGTQIVFLNTLMKPFYMLQFFVSSYEMFLWDFYIMELLFCSSTLTKHISCLCIYLMVSVCTWEYSFCTHQCLWCQPQHTYR